MCQLEPSDTCLLWERGSCDSLQGINKNTRLEGLVFRYGILSRSLLQNRQRIASRIHRDRGGLSGGHLEVQNAIFSRAEVAHTGLVEYGSGGSDGVAQEERTAGAYRCAQAVEVSA